MSSLQLLKRITLTGLSLITIVTPKFYLDLVVQDFGASRLVQLYAPPTANIDGNLAILWILAVGTVAFGAYWAGITNSKLL